ncbi:hypothetical protein AAFF_G00218930 [Aldrovandia affinis]|uniref:Uncharacterized protein n=1 Tax=Aldrovandia affinis TaxID=143900 RepID=A0AAD7SW00_9TELE|nr:hypothetical protein AAFF_G00218930 [Aldrovandia affinis]
MAIMATRACFPGPCQTREALLQTDHTGAISGSVLIARRLMKIGGGGSISLRCTWTLRDGVGHASALHTARVPADASSITAPHRRRMGGRWEAASVSPSK